MSKRNNSKDVWTRVMVFMVCIFSDDAPYFYEVWWKYFHQFSCYRADTKWPLSIFKGEQIQKLIDKKLWFLWSERCLMMLYICLKFHENILNGFQAIEQTRFFDRQTDGRANNQGKNNMSPLNTLGKFFAIFYIGNFCDILFAFLHTNPHLKRGLLLKEKNLLQLEQIL